MGDYVNREMTIPFYTPNETKFPVSAIVSYVDVDMQGVNTYNHETGVEVKSTIKNNGSIGIALINKNIGLNSLLNILIIQDDEII